MQTIPESALVEIEFELNRSDILHCRVIALEHSEGDRLLLSQPPPVENGYAFRKGDAIDIFVSLLATGECRQVLHGKATVLSHDGQGLLLRRTGFERRVQRPGFHLLQLKTPLHPEPLSGPAGTPGLSAVLRSLTLEHLRLDTSLPMEPGSRWQFPLTLSDTPLLLTGSIIKSEARDYGHEALVQLQELEGETLRQLAADIEDPQIRQIRDRFDEGFHALHSRHAQQDGLVLEHLVPRSLYRRILDGIILAAWVFAVLIAADVLLSLPPGPNFFDRLFGLSPNIVWNKTRLQFVPVYTVLCGFLSLAGIVLHQFIYYRGNTRMRPSLWVSGLLSLAAWFLVRSHL